MPEIDPARQPRQPRQQLPRHRVAPAPTPALCLDFANTRFWRGTAAPTESLPDYAALQQWLGHTGVVDADTLHSLGLLPTTDDGAVGQLFGDTLRLRELLYRLFSALADSVADQADVQALATWLAGTPARQHWVFGEGGGWQLSMLTPSASEVLAPVLWSAADLSLSLHRLRLRSCANPQCRWLFLDDSKGGSRRWCSMSSCGNRAKVRRHFLRHSGREVDAA